MFMNVNCYRKKLLTINCTFIEILYNFETLTLQNKSPSQAAVGSGFCTDPPPPLENDQNFRKGGSLENYSDVSLLRPRFFVIKFINYENE